MMSDPPLLSCKLVCLHIIELVIIDRRYTTFNMLNNGLCDVVLLEDAKLGHLKLSPNELLYLLS